MRQVVPNSAIDFSTPRLFLAIHVYRISMIFIDIPKFHWVILKPWSQVSQAVRTQLGDFFLVKVHLKIAADPTVGSSPMRSNSKPWDHTLTTSRLDLKRQKNVMPLDKNSKSACGRHVLYKYSRCFVLKHPVYYGKIFGAQPMLSGQWYHMIRYGNMNHQESWMYMCRIGWGGHRT